MIDESIGFSYNVNSFVVQDLINADDYRPKFIRVPLAGVP
jgi:hypothetical protein